MGVSVLLYVEDDDAAYTLVSIILHEQAPTIRLFRARNGDEALSYLLAEQPNLDTPKPDLILLDLNLPGKNGIEVLSELKSRESLRTIPVVMFTTSSAAKDKKSALGGGALEFITKPSSFDLFVEAVRMVCEISEAPESKPPERVRVSKAP